MISAGQNTGFSTNKTLNVNGRLLVLDPPVIMGILNVTPDSFYDGGRYNSENEIGTQVEIMINEGAGIIDVGGYSSRPGADAISVEEETKRIIPALRLIHKNFPGTLISIDTFRSEVARVAVLEGAHLINDISGGELDNNMFQVAGQLKVPYILMHMKGTPLTMNALANYDNLILEMMEYFHRKIRMLHSWGVNDIIIDPGFGFAKTADHNFQILNSLDHFKHVGKPILAGLSRKSTIWRTLNIKPGEALNGTTALNMAALMKGASLLRVHDVREASEVVKLFTNLSRPTQSV
jgi:dihydropteroate synthase